MSQMQQAVQVLPRACSVKTPKPNLTLSAERTREQKEINSVSLSSKKTTKPNMNYLRKVKAASMRSSTWQREKQPGVRRRLLVGHGSALPGVPSVVPGGTATDRDTGEALVAGLEQGGGACGGRHRREEQLGDPAAADQAGGGHGSRRI